MSRRRLLVLFLVGLCLAIVLLYLLQSRTPELQPESIAYDFCLPLEGGWTLSQDFAGWNSGWCGYHLGEDVGRGSAVPVYAAADGVVRFAALAQLGYGYVVIVEHRLPPNDPVGEYVCTVYGHLEGGNLTSLGKIRKGELVGCLSEDPEHNGGFIHLHFGIRIGRYVETIRDDRRGGWYYGGYTTIFGECNKSNPVHQQILSEWLSPTTDLINGEGFINSRESAAI